jgi:hypothetical protein
VRFSSVFRTLAVATGFAVTIRRRMANAKTADRSRTTLRAAPSPPRTMMRTRLLGTFVEQQADYLSASVGSCHVEGAGAIVVDGFNVRPSGKQEPHNICIALKGSCMKSGAEVAPIVRVSSTTEGRLHGFLIPGQGCVVEFARVAASRRPQRERDNDRNEPQH